MQHFQPRPHRALLVPKRGGTPLYLSDRPSGVPVAWEGGDSFVVAGWDSALPESFYFSFRAVHATEWSLAIPEKCISSVQERFPLDTGTSILTLIFLDKWSSLYDRDVSC